MEIGTYTVDALNCSLGQQTPVSRVEPQLRRNWATLRRHGRRGVAVVKMKMGIGCTMLDDPAQRDWITMMGDPAQRDWITMENRPAASSPAFVHLETPECCRANGATN